MTNNPLKLSVISPVYGAASVLPELVARIKASAARITGDYEIILVEDSSPDDSWEIIKRLAAADRRIIGLSLSRNFGQQYALNAGLDAATGDWIVTLDCDLQDEPEPSWICSTRPARGTTSYSPAGSNGGTASLSAAVRGCFAGS
jgi:dolichol-phosphate mannosyltransferase